MQIVKKFWWLLVLAVIASVVYVLNIGSKPANTASQANKTALPTLMCYVDQGHEGCWLEDQLDGVANITGSWCHISNHLYHCGYFAADGTMVIKPYIEAHPFAANGLAKVRFNGQYGYLNTKGEWAIEPQFAEAEDFADNGLARAMSVPIIWGYINTQGEWVIEPQFYEAEDFSDDGWASVHFGGPNDRDGYINTKGEQIEPQFRKYISKSGLYDNLHNGKWGYTNSKGKWVIKPQFDKVSNFADDGLARVMLNDKWGFINITGTWVIEPQFDKAGKFNNNGVAMVEVDDKWGYINRQGQWIIKPQFDAARDFNDSGVAWVVQHHQSMLINQQGQTLATLGMVCDTPFVKDKNDAVVWPHHSVADICAEATYKLNKKAPDQP